LKLPVLAATPSTTRKTTWSRVSALVVETVSGANFVLAAPPTQVAMSVGTSAHALDGTTKARRPEAKPEVGVMVNRYVASAGATNRKTTSGSESIVLPSDWPPHLLVRAASL
jgi:hypothetical protein